MYWIENRFVSFPLIFVVVCSKKASGLGSQSSWYWQDILNRRIFFEDFAKKHNMDPPFLRIGTLQQVINCVNLRFVLFYFASMHQTSVVDKEQ